MVRVVVNTVHAIGNAAPGNIDLTADDGLDSGSLRSLIKINTAVHHTVIRNGYGGLSQFLDPVHHTVYAAGTVQQTVFGMYMQMGKAHRSISFASSTSRFSR